MNDEIKEILTNCEKAINEASGYNDTTDKILDYITNLQQIEQEHKKINGELREENSKLEIALQNIQEDYDKRLEENERLKMESEKLTQLWLDSQEKRRKAIEYLEQPYRDNFDYSKAELLNILQNGDNSND